MMSGAFLKKVKDTIRQYDMLHKGDRVLVAVSGGPDSVCLLKVLLDIRNSYDLKIVIGNLDHGIRGKESKADSAFVKDLAKRLKVKYAHKRISIKFSGGKSSLEEIGRERRYAFLMDAARQNDCNVIATGHTMNDQAETVLLRVINGSSLAGLSGIPPVRFQDKNKIIRPLIRTDRKEILEFLKANALRYVEDSSNLNIKILRNSVRHRIIPYLEKYNPSLKRTLVNLSDTLREDYAFIQEEKKNFVIRHKGFNPIYIKDIIFQPETVRKELFKELFRRAGGNLKKLTYRHWMDMNRLLRRAESGKSIDLPGKVKFTIIKGKIIFTRSAMLSPGL